MSQHPANDDGTGSVNTPSFVEVTHAVVDGSRNGNQGGYAVVIGLDAHTHVRSACCIDQDPELLAIEAALAALPHARHLVIHTDCQEAHLRLRLRRTPRRTSANEATLTRIEQALSRRRDRGHRTEFRLVHQATREHPAHAAAHLLAFLARAQAPISSTQVDHLVRRVMGSTSPNAVAHDLVRDLLFPRAAR